MDYNPQEIEPKHQQNWAKNKLYKTENQLDKPKYYVLDMFPYPSGAGLHVGHPLGYIASDIMARYKRLKGFNVLHPMGFDSFGLPAEQYALETGQHPAVTTAQNIQTFKNQLAKIGFSFDWEREVQTSSPDFYRWTQEIFRELFQHWYNQKNNKAEPISKLVSYLEKHGNQEILAACDDDTPEISAEDWVGFSEKEKSEFLLKYRLTYLSEAVVNWCPAMGTVLANDEVKDGFSERGGHPVERKKMKQWMMRITAYAERLLTGLNTIDFPEPMKEMQRNWIGKSFGAELTFKVVESDIELTVFTTRPDTSFGVTYVSIAPEHELITELTTPEQKEAVENYVNTAKNRSERERMADVKTVSGVFTGSYVLNPFTNEKIPLWVADYVLAGYGTGVVMAVPSSDDRDYRFATYFDLPVIRVISGTEELENPCDKKHGKMINSGFLNGVESKDAVLKAIEFAEENNFGKRKINYKIRDAVFGRQRYWGEPIPVFYKNDIPDILPSEELPMVLPEISEYRPTEDGEPPLARAKNWNREGYEYEKTTMPGWAGSSWYFIRYKDAQNSEALINPEIEKYWGQVDLYIGGSEHATGHLMYSRFWNKFLHDIGIASHEEPYKKLINQGMIQGMSSLIYKVEGENKFVSKGLRKQYKTSTLHVYIKLVKNDILDIEAFKKWRPEYANAEFVLEDGDYICGSVVEKMSKRWYNVTNPDDVIADYGADTLRLYEMFLGPLTQSKPWDTKGIDGVSKFLKKLWRLFFKNGKLTISDQKPTPAEFKALHKTIKKVEQDLERDSFNTPVSEFMICVNELTSLKCNKREILSDLLVLISPYAPHITEELWQQIGNSTSILEATFPTFDEKYLKEDTFEYPVMVNGKMRTKIQFSLQADRKDIEKTTLENEVVQKWTAGKTPKKVIIVPKKIINIVL